MITLHYKKIRLTALILLALPAIVFFVTWLKLFIGIPCAILLAIVVFLASKCEDREIKIKKSTLIALAALLVLWAFLSGQGGFFTQKRDYEYRNVIFRDLINFSWPVRYKNGNDESLVYYIGYWLIPALFGKLGVAIGGFKLGWLVARISILIWTVILLYVTVLVVLFKVGKGNSRAVFITLAIFILFSGMDALGAIYAPKNFLSHIEWWSGSFQFSSMSTQLCWVFNQAVPAWLACAVAFNEKDEKSFALIGLLLLPTSPLPLVGLAVYMLAFAVRDLVISVKKKQTAQFFKNVFTLQNIIAVITLGVVYLLYYSNNAVSTDTSGSGTPGFKFAFSEVYVYVMYFMFVLLEFGFLLLALKKKENRFNSLVILCSLLVIPLITVGNSIDFCMRASIPALFLLMLMLMEYLVPELTKPKEELPDKSSKEYQQRMKKLIAVMLIFI
ncbi:MAG: hypothetical protein IKF64_03135, partial [Eubacterium sp.]|nr:hypothetical protein [Eubacterium sp.]